LIHFDVPQEAEDLVLAYGKNLLGNGLSTAFITGSRVTGGATRFSDLDVWLLHDSDWWQKVVFDAFGLTIELSIASDELLRSFLRDRRRDTAKMIVGSRLLFDATGAFEELRALSDDILAQEPTRAAASPFDFVLYHRPFSHLGKVRGLVDEGRLHVAFACAIAIAEEATRIFVTRASHRTDSRGALGYLERHHTDTYALFIELVNSGPSIVVPEILERLLRQLYADVGGVVECGASGRAHWTQAALFFR
jgi:hypothetical protein